MIGWLLDTNVVAELASPHGEARVHAWAAGQDEGRLYLSILTLSEYEKGLHNLPITSTARPRIKAALDAIEARFAGIGMHPDIAGYQDLGHAFDLRAAALAARATLRAALERRETRGAHNRSDYPDLDPSLTVNLVWSADDTIAREEILPIPHEIQALIEEVSVEGKLIE